MSNNRFSGGTLVNDAAEALYQAKMGSGLAPGEWGLGIEQFASCVSDIMTTPAPARFSIYYASNRVAVISVDRPHAPEGPTPNVWDHVTINGVRCGNRCGGRAIFTAMVFPFLVERVAPHSADGDIGETTRVHYRDAVKASALAVVSGAR